MTQSKRRFIAGAVCPKCAAMDKVVVYEESGSQYRACVVCDFVELQPEVPDVAPIPTRVSTADAGTEGQAAGNANRIDVINIRD